MNRILVFSLYQPKFEAVNIWLMKRHELQLHGAANIMLKGHGHKTKQTVNSSF